MSVDFGGPVWMIGCGNMGGAMLRRWVAWGLDPAVVTVVTRGTATVPGGVRAVHTPPADAPPAAIVLAVKPQQLDAVAPMLAHVRPRLLISILAGVESATLAQRIAADTVLRAMPNLPVAIGKGVTALFADRPDPRLRRIGNSLAAPLGVGEWIADERAFDVVTALAGSGPGFTFRFIESLAAAGEALGLAGDQALRMAIATVEGAAMMAAGSHETPGQLADRVASKGGSTREGLDVLDEGEALTTLLRATLAAAATRNRAMAAAAR